MVAPFPDKDGNITVNVMAVWVCPLCGYKNRGKIASIKSGDVPSAKKSYTDRLVEFIQNRRVVTLEELSKEFNTDKKTIRKAVEYLIKKNLLNAIIENDSVKVL